MNPSETGRAHATLAVVGSVSAGAFNGLGRERALIDLSAGAITFADGECVWVR
jgi:hypothetical protein